MNLQEAQNLARSEMNRYGLRDWELDINYVMKTTFGKCQYLKKIISLSAILITLNDETQVLDTIRHEIAHALRENERSTESGKYGQRLTAGQWHDRRWQQIAAHMGSTPTQFYNSPGNGRSVNTGRTRHPWIMTCPNCGVTGKAVKRRTKACCKKCYDATGLFFHWIYTSNI